MKHTFKRFLALVLCMCMVFALLPNVTLTVFAATSGTITGLIDKNIGLSFSGDADGDIWSASGTGITGSVIGTAGTCSDSHYNSTLTITNKKTTMATLSFDYAIEQNSGTIHVDGTDVSSSSGASFSKELAANETVKVYIKSGSTSAATKITLTNVALVSNVTATTTFLPAENGTYTVDGKVITEEYSNTRSSLTAYQVVATPAAGYQFMGWYDVTNGKYINTAATAALFIESNCTITAKFASKTAALFETGGQPFDNLNEAVDYAQKTSQTKITLASDGSISGSYTIPAGITLLIPFDAAGTLYTDAPAAIRTAPASKPFRTLTMSAGTSITVNGAISLGGRYYAAGGGEQGRPVGDYGYIKMADNSSITVKNGGNLYAWGFISGSGSVLAESGATVYEFYQIADFRGGSASSTVVNGGKRVFPFSQYFVQNIEVPLTLNAGAAEQVYSGVYAMSSTYTTAIKFIGDDGMFKVKSGSFTKDYDETTDRLVFTVNGEAELNTLSLTLAGMGVDSASYVLPITNNITIDIQSGNVTINQDAALLAGVEVNIAEGAGLTVANGKNVYVYDSDEWNSDNFVWGPCKFKSVAYAPGKAYNRSNANLVDAKIDVNGSVTAIGSIYTTAGGANICSSNGTGKYIQQGTPGTEAATYQYNASSQAVTIPITPAKLHNADGTYTETATASAGDVINYVAGVWGGEEPEEFTITFESNGSTEYPVEGTMHPQTVTEKTDTALTANTFTREGYNFLNWNTQPDGTGERYSDGAAVNLTADITLYAQWEDNHSLTTVINGKEATCTEDGYTGDTVCKICGKLITEGAATPAKGHSWSDGTITTAPTCESDGVKTYTCTVCSETKTETINATGHTPVDVAEQAPTCTKPGHEAGTKCSACDKILSGMTEIPATGHTEAIDAAVEPTCTAPGKTEGKHCSVCNEVLVAQDVVPAKGHSWDDGRITTAATCESDGVKTYTCTVCNETRTEAISATGHTSVDVAEQDPTCTEPGHEAGTKCDVCGTVLTGMTEIPATGHTEAIDEAVEPTCTAPGKTEGKHCLVCDEVLVAQNTIPAKGHIWDEGKITTAPTCESDGVKTYTCTVCNETRTEAIAATGHTSVEVAKQDPTCTKPGHEAGTKCSVCDAVLSGMTEIPATGHTEAIDEAVEPTCTAPGKTEGKHCAVCNEVLVAQEVTPALGHKEEIRGAVEPTLTTPGYTGDTYCPVCSELLRTGTDIPKTGAHITWMIDGQVAAEEDILKGTMPSFKGSTDKAPDDTHRYTFTGWDPEVVIAEEDTTYTAQYSAKERVFYIITFDANGGTGEMAAQTFEVGVDTTLNPNAFTREGYAFDGWNTAADGSGADYDPNGSVLALTENMTLYAKWKYWNGLFRVDAFGNLQYYIEGVVQRTGWTEYQGNTYYFDPDDGFARRGISELVPKGAEETARCVFDTDGVFQRDVTGVYDIGEDTYWLSSGIIEEDAGLKRVVKDDGEVNYYYFGEDGKACKAAEGTEQYVVENNNGYALPEGNHYWFDEAGVIVHFSGCPNGIYYDEPTDNYYYCVDGVIIANGLMLIDGHYYYARTSTGAFVRDQSYWVSKTNDLLEEGIYSFDHEGRIVFPTEPEKKNGFVSENGGLYYYENGVLTGAGLIKVDGSCYYVRTSTGEVICGRSYWVTATNGLMPVGRYTFDSDGKMILDEPEVKNGVVSENGNLYYYENGVLTGAGLVEINGDYYYVRTSNGEVIHDKSYWVTATNGLLPAGLYRFGSDGKLLR